MACSAVQNGLPPAAHFTPRTAGFASGIQVNTRTREYGYLSNHQIIDGYGIGNALGTRSRYADARIGVRSRRGSGDRYGTDFVHDNFLTQKVVFRAFSESVSWLLRAGIPIEGAGCAHMPGTR